MPEQARTAANWYLVQCKPRQDERAEENLRNQHFICYRPEREVEKLRGGRRVRLRESLFPGYLFVRLDSEGQDWSVIRSTRGVGRMVRFGDMPAIVDPVIIHNLKVCCDRRDVRPALTPGDRVRVMEGPFRELEAIYLRDSSDERVILMINLLQRQQTVKMPLTAIQPASGHPSGLDPAANKRFSV